MNQIEELDDYGGQFPITVEDLKNKVNELCRFVNRHEIALDLDCDGNQHDKCYSLEVLVSSIKRRWICRVCGKQGEDKVNLVSPGEFMKLVYKFEGFQ